MLYIHIIVVNSFHSSIIYVYIIYMHVDLKRSSVIPFNITKALKTLVKTEKKE